MRTIYKNIYFFMLASVFLFAACDSDDPFAGKDNYITSFSLKQDGKVINATITDDVITIKVPDGTSLNGAVATVTLSENARIYPDPATITEWDDDILFAVTSYSGSQVKYKYTVDRNSIDRKGTVLLETQEDVDAFGESDITAIGGNLIIGRTAGADSIRTLAPLSRLKRIEYSLIIYPTYAAEDFSGLENLETVGDAIQIESVKNVTGFSFQKLKTAGSIYIKNTQILTAEFPQLTSVTKGFTLDCPLKAVSLPKLKTVGEALTFNTANGSMAMLPKLTLPVLENAGKLAVSFFKSTPKVDFPKLKTVGDMSFNQMSLLAFINCPKLETVTGTLTIPSGMALAEVGFPALTEAKNMSIDGKTIKVFDFPKLKTIKGNLILQNVPVNGVADGFPALTAIEGELQLRELPNMVSFTHSPVLKKIGKLSLYNRTTLALKTANIKGLQVGELALQSAAVVINIIGDEEFKGTLTIDPQSFPNTVTQALPTLTGFSTVDSLSFTTSFSYITNVNLTGI
ncbi:MAG: DUF5018 domain-containing protein, partial [Prevotella sp.]|nr:DUF5018 domain-containing protein [Prevotella sp.]